MKMLLFILPAFMLTSCSSSVGESALMDPYQESCHLIEQDLDSVSRFDVRFHADFPASKYEDDELYERIEGNVVNARSYFNGGFSLTVDTAWAGSTIIPF